LRQDSDRKRQHTQLGRPSSSAGIFSCSPEEDVTVTSVTLFSAMLRLKKTNPQTLARFSGACRKQEDCVRQNERHQTDEIIDHSHAFAFNKLSRPVGHVNASTAPFPSDESDFGPSTHRNMSRIKSPRRKDVPIVLSVAQNPPEIEKLKRRDRHGTRIAWTIALRSRKNHNISFRYTAFLANRDLPVTAKAAGPPRKRSAQSFLRSPPAEPHGTRRCHTGYAPASGQSRHNETSHPISPPEIVPTTAMQKREKPPIFPSSPLIVPIFCTKNRPNKTSSSSRNRSSS